MSAETLADALTADLTSRLPQVLLNLDGQGLQDLDWAGLKVTPHQERGLTVFPAVEVVVRSDQVVGYEYTDTGSRVLRMQYTVRVYGTVRAGSFDETDRARKRLTAALRELLLDGLANTVPSRVRASYSDIDRDRNGRSLAAGYVEAVLTVIEPARTPTVGAPLPDDEPVLQFAVGVHHIEEPTTPGGTP